ncbi:ATP-binding cassette domain-containing protein [Burkholderia plantarii]|uniref:methionine ABC transporter ATP-binding protein n=1 Tax=Burkholderia plantarii TaxID=41899 RepID=UPI00272D1682|nr:ATP-binding cassette domain-containing protein [Burkholderia plantarii]WLE62888.1 ATP-binding cassette domain-containing protein [Burkholderia plantarii]
MNAPPSTSCAPARAAAVDAIRPDAAPAAGSRRAGAAHADTDADAVARRAATAREHLHFIDVHKRYPGAHGPIDALRGISLTVERGDVFGIIGRSGAGKSTLLRAINMLEPPDSGQVRIDGVDVRGLDEAALVLLRRRIGMIFQHFNLLSAKTVGENVALPLRVAGVGAKAARERALALLEMVGLADRVDAYPARLSGGQKQRVGIARALVHDPEILLCDEATSALDPETTQSILALLRQINRRFGLTIVLITHDMAVIREICNKMLVLDQGRVVEHGPVWEIFGAPRERPTQALLQPLQQDLPPALAERLVAALDGRPGRAIVSLRLPGHGAGDGVPLAVLRALGDDAVLLHGALDHFAGHPQGRLLFSMPADLPLDVVRRQLAALRPEARIEVKGYVADHA